MEGNRALAEARAELARLAAENERFRIARDLRDLLGHSLTTITVKAGLARQLGEADPPRALQEIAEVEGLARRSLADVRAAVTNYRDVTLAGELAAGRELLRASGITADLPRAVDAVDPTHQELFGWVVREGLTNVVRHAHASSCAVRLSASSVEIVDDGVGGGGQGADRFTNHTTARSSPPRPFRGWRCGSRGDVVDRACAGDSTAAPTRQSYAAPTSPTPPSPGGAAAASTSNTPKSRAELAARKSTLIEGPAGVGKTELAREARAAAERARIMPLEARGSELEQPFAFGVVRQLLEPVINGASGQTDLFAGAAGPAARLFEPEERHSPGADAGFEALHSLYWLVVNLADQAPVLVLVDDCHWVDRDSLRFLTYLAQRVEGLPVAMLLAGRPPDSAVAETGPLWAQVASRPSAVALYPRPLSQAAALALARERLGAQAAEEFCRSCHTATGGNPLFLHELLRALDAAGVVPSAAAASEVQAVGPAAVSRFVLHRLARLGPSASELARAVAVLGDDSELALAGRVSGVSEDAAREAADDLVRAEIFVRAERLGFVHPIVRAALYEDLAPGERKARHAAAAEALANDGASPERVTAHLLLTAATGDQRRVDTLRSAAVSAARDGAPRAAAVRLRRALAESPEQQQRAEILTELGRYEVAAMEFEAAEKHLHAALTSGAKLTPRADAASTLGRCAIVSGGRAAETAADALTSLAQELRPLDPERSLELGSKLLMLTTAIPRLRPGLAVQLQRFRDQAWVTPASEPWRESTAPRSSSSRERRPQPPSRKCRRRSPPAYHPARRRTPRFSLC
ncbi:MAG: histidine kinase [Solirubrobacteraceae bacterium]